MAVWVGIILYVRDFAQPPANNTGIHTDLHARNASSDHQTKQHKATQNGSTRAAAF